MTKLSAQQMLSRARAHEKNSEFSEAQKVYEAILADYPNNVRARKALDNLQAPASALNRSEPRKQELETLVSLYHQGRLKDVINNGKALIKRHPYSHFLFNIVGAANGGLDQFEDAEGYFRRASQLEPDYADSHNNLGNVLKEQNKLEEAEYSYRTALGLDPRFAEAHYNLGIVLDRQGELEEAEDCHSIYEVLDHDAQALQEQQLERSIYSKKLRRTAKRQKVEETSKAHSVRASLIQLRFSLADDILQLATAMIRRGVYSGTIDTESRQMQLEIIQQIIKQLQSHDVGELENILDNFIQFISLGDC